MSKIFILSSGVQTGKTSLLQKFILKYTNTIGFLTPDINGQRNLLDIANNIYHKLQIVEKQNEDDIEIGKYIFSNKVFLKAQNIFLNPNNLSAEYFIIDEVGKLELAQKGLEPALSIFLNQYQDKKELKPNLIIVIRDYLLEQCIEKYKLQNAIVLNLNSFSTKFNLQ